jgi:hypothetical protein
MIYASSEGHRLCLAVSRLLDTTSAHLLRVLKAYDPDQPRAPGGTEEAGQWISAGSDATPIVVAGGFTKDQMGMTVREFVSNFCVGKNNREVPGQFWGYTIEELLQAKRDGVPESKKCYKILNQDRFL